MAPLYAVSRYNPYNHRREVVAVAFGLVNAYYIKQELNTLIRPAYIAKL